MVSCVQLWDRTFALPYNVYRHRLREIARINLSRVSEATCAEWSAIPEGEIVVPVDDDDWFSPHLGVRLAGARDPARFAYLWQPHFLEVPVHLSHEFGRLRRRLLPTVTNRHLCITNNYAMVKRPQHRLLLKKHVRASRWFEPRLETTVRIIDEPLSIMNRSIGSITSLRGIAPPLARARLLLRYRRYRRLYRTRPPDALAWTGPYRAMMADLMDDLLPR
jgi:hypothetical protein